MSSTLHKTVTFWYIENMATFREWITQKYLDWQAQTGKRKTIDEFAAYLGISRPLLNMWMNGNKPKPGTANIKLLNEIFGPEIYDVIDMPRPNSHLQKLSKIWENIPPEKQQLLVEEAERYEIENERSKNTSKQRKIA